VVVPSEPADGGGPPATRALWTTVALWTNVTAAAPIRHAPSACYAERVRMEGG
jgi:hypothetical protein